MGHLLWQKWDNPMPRGSQRKWATRRCSLPRGDTGQHQSSFHMLMLSNTLGGLDWRVLGVLSSACSTYLVPCLLARLLWVSKALPNKYPNFYPWLHTGNSPFNYTTMIPEEVHSCDSRGTQLWSQRYTAMIPEVHSYDPRGSHTHHKTRLGSVSEKT